MKKIFFATAILILTLTVTACSHAVPDNKPEKETTSVQTTTTAETTTKTQATESKIESEHTEDSLTSTENITKINSNDKPCTDGLTTIKAETTTKEKVVTTKKPETTSSGSQKLPSYYPESEIIALFNKVNNHRTQNGLPKLTLDHDICKMAYIRAQEQETLKGHDRPDGSKYYSILDEYNYSYSGCGENIAFIWNVSANEAFNKWKDSPTHNQNMLESRFTKAGIAMYRNVDGSYSIVNLFAC